LKVLFITVWYPTKDQPGKGVFVREHAKAVQLYDDVMVLHCPEPHPALKMATRHSGLEALAGFCRRPLNWLKPPVQPARFSSTVAPRAAWATALKTTWQLEQETDPALTEGVPTYRVQYRRSPIPKTSYLPYLWGVFQAYRRIVADGFRPDLIHAHVFDAGVPAVLIGRLYGTPVVITEHDSDFPRGLLSPAAVLRARLAFRWAAAVLPVSLALQRGIERYGIRARFSVIPNVVDTRLFTPPSVFRPSPGPLRILFVGTLIPVKGLPFLLRALAQWPQPRARWHLDIVGDGSHRTEYERLATELGLTAQVNFHGFRPKAEVADFMRQADLFVLPSLWENFPCVLLEALASGLPIVSTYTGGIPEIVDDAVGQLVPPGDSESLAQALTSMLASPDRFDRHTLAQRAARYSPTEVGRTLHAIYQDCLRP
jgi:glycosyltransferase involved in cell wall biosynthesis